MPLEDDTPMPHGEHKGTNMEDIPADYLLWLDDQPWLKASTKWKEVREYIDDSRLWLEDEVARQTGA